MKKLILIMCVLFLYGYMSYGQDEEVISSGSRIKYAAYSPSTSAIIGVHGGLLGNSGGVISGNDVLQSGGIYLSARYNNRNILNLDRLSVDLGVSMQLIEMAYVFVGAGYGEYKYPYREPSLLPDKEIKGLEIEGGAILKIGKFNLHAGVSTLKFEHLDFFGGVGYTF
ncbi:MAG: hypothetical protein P1P88_11320 [Bacteroidales bacterium]|nr:hypothetical protein [Bacteroidales bacterium]